MPARHAHTVICYCHAIILPRRRHAAAPLSLLLFSELLPLLARIGFAGLFASGADCCRLRAPSAVRRHVA